jgi:hypothetical protein
LAIASAFISTVIILLLYCLRSQSELIESNFFDVREMPREYDKNQRTIILTEIIHGYRITISVSNAHPFLAEYNRSVYIESDISGFNVELPIDGGGGGALQVGTVPPYDGAQQLILMDNHRWYIVDLSTESVTVIWKRGSSEKDRYEPTISQAVFACKVLIHQDALSIVDLSEAQ